MKSFDLSLFADYFQFYIQDESATGDLSEAWTPEATDRLLAIVPGMVGISTVRNMHVPVSVQVLEREPDHDSSDWDHVVEASLDVASGRIVIAGCTDYFPDAMRIETEPGTYRVRVSYGALDTLSEDGLEGDDHYRLQLWPAPSIAVRVLKQRPT
ncbi:hypothetical protein ACE103_18670 [Bradyrhizobium sp. ma5]|uniref:hypothetical protein n=1 Tax=Bradyrhizobium sp. ma5 TaxID=3344828 RepID=UPI0035D45AEB